MIKVGIMQPYFFPYIGYFQLIEFVDLFIVYDNIKYTKKGWINRNRMLLNGKDVMFSLPLKKDSDYTNVCDRELATDFNRGKLVNQFKGAYLHAPYFKQTLDLVERIVKHKEQNLFRYLHHSLKNTCEHLGIKTEIKISSSIRIDHEMKNQDKVLALCEAVGASTYVNPIGGINLYSREKFHQKGVVLKFFQTKPFEYSQFGNSFVPSLSIIDVMMFNPLDKIRTCISTNYELI